VGIVGILAVAALVVVPLVREYADFRRTWGLGRLSALGVTGLVVPATAIGLAVAIPFSEWPFVQWGVTVAAALAAYSLAVRAVEGVLAPERASSHSR
jgi:ABC-type Fe3+ transport system permease subunit